MQAEIGQLKQIISSVWCKSSNVNAASPRNLSFNPTAEVSLREAQKLDHEEHEGHQQLLWFVVIGIIKMGILSIHALINPLDLNVE